MLSRHAEDVFWIGRYVERAEDTARLLDVPYHVVLEAATDRSPAELWSELLETLLLADEVPEADAGAGDQVGALLIADRGYPGSLVSIVARARENARTTREWLSVEVWEAINDLHLRLARADLAETADSRPYEVLQMVKSAARGSSGRSTPACRAARPTGFCSSAGASNGR
jgi:uncharacterized alpha-E superfamily protein